MKPKIHYRELEGRSLKYWAMVALFGLLVVAGCLSSYYMESNGHWVTGMTNQVVWGMPHVFAVFLIVAASGALNVASIGSVFGKTAYKPLAPLSGLLAVALLIGGLTVLVLDLGKPDRILVAMTHYNFRSIFAWNIYLYTGFMAIVAVYLWMLMERRMNRFSKPVGMVAFIWRLILTTGTGSIFGFLVSRQAYDFALMAPMFVIMSFSFGLAIFLLVLMAAYRWSGRTLGDHVVYRLKNLLGVFIAAVLYFVMVYHITKIYMTSHDGFERFILLDGGIYTALFWGVQIFLGSLVPLALVYHPRLGRSRPWIATAAALVVIGGLAQMYVIIIGGEVYPIVLFPGMQVSSSFYDGIINTYIPSLPEIILGISGIGLAMAIVSIAIKFLPFLPQSLEDRLVDPHHPLEVLAADNVDVAPAEEG